VIANERGGQGRYCSKVQSGAVVGRGLGRLVARTLVSAPVKAPALPAVLLRRSVCLCMAAAALRPNVLVLYRRRACHDSASTAIRPAGSIHMPVRACSTPPPVSCHGRLRTKALTARHTQCSIQLAHSRPAMLAACARRWEGKRAGGSLTVRLTREWAYLARDGVA
jgi:hypothetical protein